jgi:Ca2+-binding RTX toxin-like protein
MAYNDAGTNGNDLLNHINDTGPGTIVGLAGNDTITAGRGVIFASGGSGNDNIYVGGDETGTVDGGSGDDYIASDAAEHPFLLLGGEGRDEFEVINTTFPHTILGGNDSNDDADRFFIGLEPDLVFGHGGNDTISDAGGNNTLIGGFGGDSIRSGSESDIVFGNEGNDTVRVAAGDDTVFGGLGDDSLTGTYTSADSVQFFGNEGADTIFLTGDGIGPIPIGGGGRDTIGAGAATILGGNDLADGADLLISGAGADFIFGNGGDDGIDAGNGANTVVGGFGADTIRSGTGADLVFANESDDRVQSGDGNDTVFAGRGSDFVLAGAGADSIQGNENDDLLVGQLGADTMSGGSGRDDFAFETAGDDGNGAAGGAIERITDLNWAEDSVHLGAVGFAADVGTPGGANLSAAAGNAIAAAFTLNGGANQNVAAPTAPTWRSTTIRRSTPSTMRAICWSTSPGRPAPSRRATSPSRWYISRR